VSVFVPRDTTLFVAAMLVAFVPSDTEPRVRESFGYSLVEALHVLRAAASPYKN